ncbi:hypothetical protein FDG2_5502 [Candidatus Protofrankia californiensis]|uniref:Uncharacterized protein n=1 Tax=Candidatus Protofrankia californiensis TaxID=1839754 RepID=A0A1C3PDX2_9ACTN|nr:hypothetical protein FDG2_5502 [Candidatus Protofrankia californiensis]
MGQVLRQGGLVDVAAHLADTRCDPALLQPTGAGRVRVDQAHVTPLLLPAVADYRRVDPQGHSDRWGVVVTLDVEKVDPSATLTWI